MRTRQKPTAKEQQQQQQANAQNNTNNTSGKRPKRGGTETPDTTPIDSPKTPSKKDESTGKGQKTKSKTDTPNKGKKRANELDPDGSDDKDGQKRKRSDVSIEPVNIQDDFTLPKMLCIIMYFKVQFSLKSRGFFVLTSICKSPVFYVSLSRGILHIALCLDGHLILQKEDHVTIELESNSG